MTFHRLLAAGLFAIALCPGEAFPKDTGLIFVSNEKTNNILVLDPKTYQVVKDVRVARRPRDMSDLHRRGDAAARRRSTAHCDMQRPGGLKQIVHVGGAPGHMADGRVVPGRDADDAQGIFENSGFRQGTIPSNLARPVARMEGAPRP